MRLGVDFNILNQKGTPAFYSDIFANRPTYGFAGRVFISTDTGAIYEDTGTSWTLIADAGAGTTGTLQQVTTNGNTTTLGIAVQGINIGTGNNNIAQNTGLGTTTLNAVTTGGGNTAIGYTALQFDTTGQANTAVGNIALNINTTGAGSTAIGSQSLANSNGDNNTAIGYQAGNSITTGSYNTIVGNYVGSAALSNNVVLADGAGTVRYQWNGTSNNFTGSITSSSLTAGSVLFAGASGLLSDSNATFFWDNTNKRLGIGNAAPGAPLDIHGTGTVAHFNGTTTNNAYILFQNAGTGKWRVGNNYNAGANDFNIYNVLTAENTITIDSSNNLTTIGTLQSSKGTSVPGTIQFALKTSAGNTRAGIGLVGTDGTNSGSDLFLYSFLDNGSPVTILKAIRATGAVNFGNTITATGIVSSGTMQSKSTLFVGDTTVSSAFNIQLQNSSNGFQFGINSTCTLFQFINGGPTVVATINGATGVYTPLSDVNQKKDFENSEIGLNEILSLKPTLYRMKNEEGTNKHLGFIAQEVKEFIPQSFVESENFIGLDFNPIVAALVKAIQQLNDKLIRNNIN